MGSQLTDPFIIEMSTICPESIRIINKPKYTQAMPVSTSKININFIPAILLKATNNMLVKISSLPETHNRFMSM
jgi:hypothetical protein